MASIQSYENLEVWQLGIELVSKVYALTKQLPPEERWGLISQLNRAAVSVPSNIAEGWGRGRTASQCQFLRIARGSLYELETLLVVCTNEYAQTGGQAQTTKLHTEVLAKKLNAFLTVVSNSVQEVIAPHTIWKANEAPC